MQTTPLETSNGPLVDCYNCCGGNTRTECGLPLFGCELCEMCGDGKGHIYSKYRSIPITIGNQIFTPPTYSCLWCKDTKKATYSIWDPDLVNSSWSDHGAHNMPQVMVACRACMEKEHQVEYENAKTNYFNSKVKKGQLVDCYNCRGQNTRIMCGMPQFGCVLCKTYGDNEGHIYSPYRTTTVTINGKVFTPPSYICLECRDTRKAKYSIWDPDLVDSGCSDYGAHNMPKVEVACKACSGPNHEVEYNNAKTNYFASKTKN